MTLVGRKGRDFFKRRDASILGEYIHILAKPAYADAATVAREVVRRYREGEPTPSISLTTISRAS